MPQVTVSSDDGLRTVVQARQHVFFADEPPDNDGEDTAPTPSELLLGAVGTCMAITVQLYARRKQWPLEGVTVTLSLKRLKPAEYPAYTGSAPFVTQIFHSLTFKGPLSEEQIVRLREIGGRCPIHRTLENPTFFVDVLPENA